MTKPKETNCHMSCGQPDPFCRAQLIRNKRTAEQQQIRSREILTEDNNSSGNPKIDEFIHFTKINSKYCDDFIEWINNNTFKNIRFICEGGFSRIYSAELNYNDNNTKVILKVLKDFRNFGEQHLKEPSNNVFNGLDYIMIMKEAKFNVKFDWNDKITLLLALSKLLKSLHEMDVLHKDFHCKNIFVDSVDKIYIGDFGLSCFGKDSKEEIFEMLLKDPVNNASLCLSRGINFNSNSYVTKQYELSLGINDIIYNQENPKITIEPQNIDDSANSDIITALHLFDNEEEILNVESSMNARSSVRNFQEIKEIINQLAHANQIDQNLLLHKIIYLMEKPDIYSDDDVTTKMLQKFVIQSALYLGNHEIKACNEATAELELLLRAMSSLVHLASKVSILETSIRGQLYDSVAKFWN
ncbi:7162_t:CDS:10, partial [Diversispora eburnea]